MTRDEIMLYNLTKQVHIDRVEIKQIKITITA